MKNFTFLVILCFAIKLESQELHVYYNVFKDSMWYLKGGKEIDNPVVKKGNKITVHLVNYNNYIYSSNFEVRQLKQSPSFDGNQYGTNSLDFTEMLAGFNQNSAPQVQLLNTSLFGSIFKVLSSSQQTGASRGAFMNMGEFNTKLETLNNEAENINEIIKIINKRKRLKSVIDVGNFDIRNLKLNPNIDPEAMKEFVLSYYKDALQLDHSGTISNDNLQLINEQLQQIGQLQLILNENLQNYQEGIKDLVKSIRLLKKMDQSNSEMIQSISKLEQKEAVLLAETSLIQNDLSNQGIIDYYQLLLNMYMNYLEIKNNTFTQIYQIKAESEYVLFNLNLVLNDTLNIQNAPISGRKAKSKTVQFVIRTYGDILIGTSIGLSVSKFVSTPLKYFVSNGTIASQTLDTYYPMFSSLINISYKFNYPVIPSFSLGAGVPFSSDDQTSGLNYFIGAGLFFGRSTKFHLSGGFVFTKVNVLLNGLKVGDPINIGDGLIPLEKKFTQGYYLGLSFNLN